MNAAGPGTAPASTLAIRLSTLAWFLLALCWLSSLPILLGASWATLPALLLPAAILAWPMAWVWCRLWRPARTRPWHGAWLRGTLGLWCLLCGTAAAPVYYLAISTETRPATVPTVTLSNGTRTVILQGMQHVGIERFYKAVVYDMEQALADDFTLYYEGVFGGDAESDRWFRQTLSGGKDLGDNYRLLGKVCGLVYQNDYMGPLLADARSHPDRHRTVDVSTRDMKREYDRLMQTDPAFAAAMRQREEDAAAESSGPPNLITDFIEQQKGGSDRQNALAGTLCRGIMTMVMRRTNQRQEDPMNAIVLDLRNRHLASQLLADTREKVYVIYGAGHLPGVIELLQREQGWQLKSVKWMRTIAAPERLEGSL